MARPVSRSARQPPNTLARPGASDRCSRRQPLRGTDHVLVEAQLSARAHDPVELGERRGLGGDRAEHQHRHGGVEVAVLEGQAISNRVDHPDRPPGFARRLGRLRAQMRLGLNGHQLRDRVGVVGEVGPASGSDSITRPRSPPIVSRRLSTSTAPSLRGDECRESREQRMIDLSGHALAEGSRDLTWDRAGALCRHEPRTLQSRSRGHRRIQGDRPGDHPHPVAGRRAGGGHLAQQYTASSMS